MAGLLSPEQMATIQGLQRIRAAMGGAPSYFGAQLRADAGEAPGAYQFNLPPALGPAAPAGDPRVAALAALEQRATPATAGALASRAEGLPASVDPMSDVRGSVPNNMRSRFLALAASNMPSEADAAVASRRPNLGLTPRDFLAERVDDPAGGGPLRRDELSADAADAYKNAATPQAAIDANRRLAAASPTAAAANTYLRVASQRAGKTPDELLAANAAAAPGRQAGRVGARAQAFSDFRIRGANSGAANLQGMMINPIVAGQLGGPEAYRAALQHNATMAQLAGDQEYHRGLLNNQQQQLAANQRETMGKLDLMGKTADDNRVAAQRSHDVAMAQLQAQLQKMQAEMEIQRQAADPKNRARMAVAESNPGAVLDEAAGDPNAMKELDNPLMRDLVKGRMTPDVLSHLQDLHNSADLYIGPEWDWLHPFKSDQDHFNDLLNHFGNSLPDVPQESLKKLTRQYYNQAYGQLPAGV